MSIITSYKRYTHNHKRLAAELAAEYINGDPVMYNLVRYGANKVIVTVRYQAWYKNYLYDLIRTIAYEMINDQFNVIGVYGNIRYHTGAKIPGPLSSDSAEDIIGCRNLSLPHYYAVRDGNCGYDYYYPQLIDNIGRIRVAGLYQQLVDEDQANYIDLAGYSIKCLFTHRDHLYGITVMSGKLKITIADKPVVINRRIDTKWTDYAIISYLRVRDKIIDVKFREYMRNDTSNVYDMNGLLIRWKFDGRSVVYYTPTTIGALEDGPLIYDNIDIYSANMSYMFGRQIKYPTDVTIKGSSKGN